MLKIIKQKFFRNWSHIGILFLVKIMKRLLNDNSGEGTIEAALSVLSVIPIDYIFFKNNEEKYSVQLSLLNILMQENMLTVKEYEKIKIYLKQKYKVA